MRKTQNTDLSRATNAIRRPLLATTILVGVVLPGAAELTDFYVTQSTGTTYAGDAAVLNDLFVSFDEEWMGGQLLIELTAGSIQQTTHPFVWEPFKAPSAGLIAYDATVTADTYYAHGVDGQTSYAEPWTVGGPVNLDVNELSVVDTPGKLALTWSRKAGSPVANEDDFRVFRLALSPDAAGSFRFFGSTEPFGYTPGYDSEFDTTVNGVPGFEIVNGGVVEIAGAAAAQAAAAPEGAGSGAGVGASPASPSSDPLARESAAFQPTDWLLNSWGTQSDVDWRSYYLVPDDSAISSSVIHRSKTDKIIDIVYAPAGLDTIAAFREWQRSELGFVDGHAPQSVGLSDASQVVATPEPALFGVLGIGALMLGRRR
ncbi:MAG: hypothetical protein AAGF84_08700 [Planctomycetota bacterium]